MNTHLDDGQLRAALDGELSKNELAHLANCAICRSRQKELESQLQFASDKLAFLAHATNASRLSSASAWSRFKNHKLTQKETSMFRKLFSTPIVRYGVPALLVLAMVFAFPGARALASELLNLFRVQRVAVIPIDFTGMEQLNGAVGNNISQLISESVTMQKEPSDPVNVTTTDEASQLAGFNVRAPQDITPSRITVMSGASFAFTIDREKAQALLDEAGRGDLVLPDEIDGADVSVNIPSSVSIAFGTCPEPSSESETAREMERETSTSGSPGRVYKDCIIFAQIPSPEVSAPASLDIAKLAQIGLELLEILVGLEFGIGLRNGEQPSIEDFARALSLQRRVPLEKTKDLAKTLQEKLLKALFP
jgi:hypothetical protein